MFSTLVLFSVYLVETLRAALFSSSGTIDAVSWEGTCRCVILIEPALTANKNNYSSCEIYIPHGNIYIIKLYNYI